MLGDAVAVQTQASDVVAVALLVVLALISVAVVLQTGAVEDAQAFSALRATGWRDRSIAMLITSQGAIIGLVGAAVGLLVAVTPMTVIFGPSPATLLVLAVAIFAAAVLAASGAALPIARHQAARPLSEFLAG